MKLLAIGSIGLAGILPTGLQQCEDPAPHCNVEIFVSGAKEYVREPDGCTNLTNSTYKSRARQRCTNGKLNYSAWITRDGIYFITTDGCPVGHTQPNDWGVEHTLR